MPAIEERTIVGGAGPGTNSATCDDSWVGVVDDNASLRIALARALRANGLLVKAFASAEEFLERRDDSEPACLVLDIHLGGMSGFDLRDRLVANGAAVPIIFITGHDDVLTEHARSRSACGYLRKPFDTAVLVALLRPHLVSQAAR